eukprot:COSAG01_NODE_10339_length_2190_cov_2.923482_1_plen_54_part_00
MALEASATAGAGAGAAAVAAAAGVKERRKEAARAALGALTEAEAGLRGVLGAL